MLYFLPEGGICVLWSKNVSLIVKGKKKGKNFTRRKTTHKTVMSNSSSWAEMKGCSQHLCFSVTGVSVYRLRLQTYLWTPRLITQFTGALELKEYLQSYSLGFVTGTRNFVSCGRPQIWLRQSNRKESSQTCTEPVTNLLSAKERLHCGNDLNLKGKIP